MSTSEFDANSALSKAFRTPVAWVQPSRRTRPVESRPRVARRRIVRAACIGLVLFAALLLHELRGWIA